MTRVFITGDIHGELSVNRLSSKSFLEGKELTKDDYVIIAGDFGFPWANDKTDKYWLKWLDEKPWTTLFIDGNHENFDLLETYHVEEWNGGKIHKIMPSVYHLMRGQMFNLHGRSFFTFGGASSIDKEYRKEGVSWWPQEIPNDYEFSDGTRTLIFNDWTCDYVITHNCSTRTLQWMSEKFGFQLKPTDAVNGYLDFLEDKIKYKKWFFGHFHENINLPRDQIMIYDQIIEIPV